MLRHAEVNVRKTLKSPQLCCSCCNAVWFCRPLNPPPPRARNDLEHKLRTESVQLFSRWHKTKIMTTETSTWAVHCRVLSHFLRGTAPACRILCYTLLNTRPLGTLRSGNRSRYCASPARALPSRNPYTYIKTTYSSLQNVVTEPSRRVLAHSNMTELHVTTTNLTMYDLHSRGELSENVFFGCI
jgi:hypothetical protein